MQQRAVGAVYCREGEIVLLPLYSDKMTKRIEQDDARSEQGNDSRKMRRKVIRQEKKAAEVIGGRTTPASGAKPTRKGDADSIHTGRVGECFLVECKHSFTTGERGYFIRFQLRWLSAVREQASASYSTGCVSVRLGSRYSDYWFFDSSDLETLCPDMYQEWDEGAFGIDIPPKKSSFIVSESCMSGKEFVRYVCDDCVIAVVRQSFVEELVERMSSGEN